MKTPFRLSYFIAAFLWSALALVGPMALICAIFSEQIEASQGEARPFLMFFVGPNAGAFLPLLLMPLAIQAGKWARTQSEREEAKSRHHGGLTIERWK